MGRDPGEIYKELTRELVKLFLIVWKDTATAEQRLALKKLSPPQVKRNRLAAKKIQKISPALQAMVNQLAD